MILPDNGKVIIVDDKREDVEPLLIALAKEKMPYLFYTDPGGSDLPENGPIANIRIVFLDLDLGIGDSSDKKQKVRLVQERLVALIEPNTPYVLVIWSGHEDTLLKPLMEDFDGPFKEYAPIVQCSLDKHDILHGEHAHPIGVIRESLKNKLAKFEAFNAFLLWESITSNAAGQVTKDFLSVFDKDEIWDKNVKNAFYKIAFAELGSTLIETFDDKGRLKLAIKIINSSLIDCVEKDINNKFDSLSIKDIKQGGPGLNEEAIIKLNTAIHLIRADDLKHFASGNLYIDDLSPEQGENLKDFFKEGQLNEVRASSPKFVQLDITPACDYSQPKQFSRIIEGVLFDVNFGRNALKPSDFIYKECPALKIEATSFLLIFDFRTLKSYSKVVFEGKFPQYPKVRLRDNLLLDIQAQLSNHINRPGIFSLKN